MTLGLAIALSLIGHKESEEMKSTHWKLHNGIGDPPIKTDTQVEVEFRDGTTEFGLMGDWDYEWQWHGSEEGESSDHSILSYRVIGDDK